MVCVPNVPSCEAIAAVSHHGLVANLLQGSSPWTSSWIISEENESR